MSQSLSSFWNPNWVKWAAPLVVGAFLFIPIYAQAQWVRQSPLPSGMNYDGVGFSSAGHGFICGEAATLFETFDAGNTWTPRDLGLYFNEPLYEVGFRDATVGFVLGNSPNIFRTSDGGSTWAQITAFPVGGSWRFVDFVSADVGFMGANGALCETTDAGLTWNVRSGYPSCPIIFGMDFRDANVGLAAGLGTGTEEGIFKSTDGGITWLNTLLQGSNSTVFLDGTTVIGARYDGTVERSTDAGDTWTPVAGPLATGLLGLARVDASTVVGVSTAGDIWRSSDTGSTWGEVFNGIGDLPGWWRVWFQDSLNGWVVGLHGVILATTDGGLTWQYKQSGIGQQLNGIDMATDTLGLAVGDNGYVLRTTDGGNHWTPARIGVTGTVFGRTETLQSVSFLDPNFAVTAGFGGIVFKTFDGGQTWQSVGYPTLPDPFRIYDVKFVSQTEGWVAGADDDLGHTNNLYHSTDGGSSWALQSVGLPVALTGVDFADALHGWVVGPSGTMWRTDNGGGTWQPVTISAGGVVWDVHFADLFVGWLVGNQGAVLRSTDGGRSWQPQNMGTTEDLASIRVMGPLEAWASSFVGSAFHTTDGGSTWMPVGANQDAGYAIAARPSGQAWMAGFGGSIFVNETCAVPLSPAASNDGPICSGQTLNLFASTIAGATYNWTGPNGFTSNLQNPSIANATTAASGVYSVTATVAGCTSAAGTTTAAVNPVPVVSPVTLPAAGMGTSYTQTLFSSAGTAPFTFAVSSGALPSGLTLTPAGVLSGTPTTSTGSPFSFTVTATDANGCTGSQSYSFVVNPAGAVLRFFTITPCRLIDTRRANGTYGGPALQGGATRNFPIEGQCGIPADAYAVSGNVTVVLPTDRGDLRLFPTGIPVPNASAINFNADRSRANNVLVALTGTPAGSMTVRTDIVGGTTNMLFDANGYFRFVSN